MASILVLDDRAANRDLLSTVLCSAGHTVMQADSGATALPVARLQRPDLIIADILMPVMDGYEFVRRLRRDPVLAETRVIFCTATYLEEDVTKLAAGCGVEHIILKPCGAPGILETVALALAAGPTVPSALEAMSYEREHVRVLNDRLMAKVIELEDINAAHEALSRAPSLDVLETVLEASPVGVYLIDRDLRLLPLHRVPVAAPPASSGEPIGRSVADAVPDLWEQIEPLQRRVLESGESVLNAPITGRIAGDPTERSWLVSHYPVTVDGRVIGVGAVVIDVGVLAVREGPPGGTGGGSAGVRFGSTPGRKADDHPALDEVRPP